jgi:hypothetical protein
VPESSSLAQVIRGIHGAYSCNGAPSLAPSCSSRCSTFGRQSPCSHTRDGRNRADRFVCQAYDGRQEFIRRAACRSCRFTSSALGCRRLAHKKFHPIRSPSHLRVVRKGRRNFRSNRRLRRSCNIGSATQLRLWCRVWRHGIHCHSRVRSVPSRRHGSYGRFGPVLRGSVRLIRRASSPDKGSGSSSAAVPVHATSATRIEVRRLRHALRRDFGNVSKD